MKNPRHIVITGASSGIGAALAEEYAEHGVTLSLQGRDVTRLDQIAEKAERRGATPTIKSLDVTDSAGMSAWLESRDALQPIDLIIANAGISGGTVFGAGEDDATARAIFATNLTGVLNTIHPVIPSMMARRRGQIAIMSSLAGFRGIAGTAAYCASKAAVRLYGEGLRGELTPYGIDVNVICPGFVATPMTAQNAFPMPFTISAPRSAAIIRKGLEANRARIAFPFPMYALVRLFAAMPQDWCDGLIARMPRKMALKR